MERKNIVFDKEDAVDRVDGDVEFLNELVKEFLQTFPQKLSTLSDLISAGNLSQAERHAHSLKGALRNLGAVKSGEVAYQMELAGKSNDGKQMASLIKPLQVAVKEFEQEFFQSVGEES